MPVGVLLPMLMECVWGLQIQPFGAAAMAEEQDDAPRGAPEGQNGRPLELPQPSGVPSPHQEQSLQCRQAPTHHSRQLDDARRDNMKSGSS